MSLHRRTNVTGTRRGVTTLIGVAAAAIAVFVFSRRSPDHAPSAAVRDWSRIASGRLHLDMRSSSPSAVSGFFVESGLPFRVESATIALPGYVLVGARVHAIGAGPSALVVHRDARNKIVVCQRFVGRVEELSRPDRIIVQGTAKLYLHRSRGGSAVLWQDGPVVRSLASDVSEEELVRLASSGAASAAP